MTQVGEEWRMLASVTLLSIVMSGTGVCLGQDYCVAKTSRWADDDDVHFALMLSLRRADQCVMIAGDSLQQYVAAAWVVDTLNNGYPNDSYIPGLKFGFELYDDCQNPTYAARNVLQILNPTLASEITDCHVTRNASLLLGIVGPSRSSTASEVSRLMKHSGIPIVSASATAVELSNKTLYPTFFRTAFADTYQIQPILQILKRLTWTYVAVVHSDDIYGRTAAAMLHDLGRKEKICFVKSLEISSQTTASDVFRRLEALKRTAQQETLGIVYFGQKDNAENLMYYFSTAGENNKMYWLMSDAVGRNEEVFGGKTGVNGILTLSPANTRLEGLNDFYKTKLSTNPLLQTYIQQNPNTKLSDGLLKQNDYTAVSVDAFYTFAVALKTAHRSLCGGSHGVCDGLRVLIESRNFLQFVKNVSVDYSSIGERFAPSEFIETKRMFSFNEDLDVVRKDSFPIYKVNSVDLTNAKKFVDVGTYRSTGLTLNTSEIRMTKGPTVVSGDNLPKSQCVGRCSECSDFGQVPMVFYPGDAYILGVFSIHGTKQDHPFQCEGFRTVASDTVVLEAFLHAVHQLRKLTGIKFGAIVFDDCYSPVRITSILSDYYSGFNSLNHDQFKEIVPKNKTVAVIGPLSSGATIPVTHFFSPLNIPVVSYSASSPDLDDRVNFPNFLRTVPSDIQQAKVMVDIILKMKWEYVGLIYVGNNYGTKGKLAFEKLASQSGICVADPFEISEADDGEVELHEVLRKLRQQQVKVVVFFGIDTQYSRFLEVVLKKKAYGDFIFLASEEWGTKQALLNTGKKAARGSLSLKLETMKPAFTSFGEALLRKNLSNNEENPWFQEFWQNQFQCNIDGGFNNVFSETCSGSEHLTYPAIERHLNDQRVDHVMNAVYAIGLGIAKAKKNLCHDSSPPFPCRFFYHPKYSKQVWESIREVSFPGGTPMFDENGNGAIGFKIYNVQQNNDKYEYVEVGTYKSDALSLKLDLVRFYNELGDARSTITAVCDGTDLCAHCVRTPTAAETGSTEVIRPLDTILIVGLALVFILVVMGIVCLIVCVRKTATGLSKDIQRHCGGHDHVYQAVSDKRVYQNPAHRDGPARYNHSTGSISFMNGSQGTLTDIPNGEVNRGFVADNTLPALLPPVSMSVPQMAQGKDNYNSSGDSVPVTVSSSRQSVPDTDSWCAQHCSGASSPPSLNCVVQASPSNISDMQVVSTSIPNGQIAQQSYLTASGPVRPSELNVMPKHMQMHNEPYVQNGFSRSQFLSMSDSNLHTIADAQSPATNLSIQRAIREQYRLSTEKENTDAVPGATYTISPSISPPVMSSPSESVFSSPGRPTEIELQLMQKQHQLHQLQQQEQMLQQQHLKQQQQLQQQQHYQSNLLSSAGSPSRLLSSNQAVSQRMSSTTPSSGASKPALPARNQESPGSSKLTGSVDSVHSAGLSVPGYSEHDPSGSASLDHTFDKITLDHHGIDAKISRV